MDRPTGRPNSDQWIALVVFAIKLYKNTLPTRRGQRNAELKFAIIDRLNSPTELLSQGSQR